MRFKKGDKVIIKSIRRVGIVTGVVVVGDSGIISYLVTYRISGGDSILYLSSDSLCEYTILGELLWCDR